MRTNVLALTAGLTAGVLGQAYNACTGKYFNFYNRDGPAMSFQRLDPALQPGTESPHLHSFDGGNALSSTTDFAATQQATCTTNRLKQDKSLYWRPTLFWNGNGTGFHRVPDSKLKIYYKYQDDYDFDEFPEDFKMIIGDPMRRSEANDTANVKWACHGADGGAAIFTKGFPKGFTSCKDGFASEVTFPTCWNGQMLDPKNPIAHMAFADQPGTGIEKCPSTHRKARFPTIFIEFWYDVSSFDGTYAKDQVPWVLSNGDPTGFGFHADFLNGWEKGVLKKAVSQKEGLTCGCSCNQGDMEAYFGKDNVNTEEDPAFKACNVAGTADAAPVLQTLPGCNPLQSGPARATAVTGAGCSATAVPAPSGNESAASSAASSVASVVASAASSAVYAASSAVVASSGKIVSTRTGRWPRPSASASTDDNPMISMSLPNKHATDAYGPTSVGASATAIPIPSSLRYSALPYMSNSTAAPVPPQGTGASVVLPSMSLASSAAPVAGESSGVPSGGADCSAPVTVTYTPTVYVTLGANSTSCASSAPTVTKTLTQIATITVDASPSGMGYASN